MFLPLRKERCYGVGVPIVVGDSGSSLLSMPMMIVCWLILLVETIYQKQLVGLMSGGPP